MSWPFKTTWVVYACFAAFLFCTGLQRLQDRPISSATLSSKSKVSTEHKTGLRIYFRYYNDDFKTIEVEGFYKVASFMRIDEEQPNHPDFKGSIVKVEAHHKKSEEKKDFNTVLKNTGFGFLNRESAHGKKVQAVIDTDNVFFVDFSSLVDPEDITHLRVYISDEERKFSLAALETGFDFFLPQDRSLRSANEQPKTIEAPSALGEPYVIIPIYNSDADEGKTWHIVFLTEAFSEKSFLLEKESIKKSRVVSTAKSYLKNLMARKPFSEFKENIKASLIATHSKSEKIFKPGDKSTDTAGTFYSGIIGGDCVTRDIHVRNSRRVIEMASLVESDTAVVLFNSPVKYGSSVRPNHLYMGVGDGEIYNSIFIHEMGHALGGLFDTYAYNISTKIEMKLLNSPSEQKKYNHITGEKCNRRYWGNVPALPAKEAPRKKNISLEISSLQDWAETSGANLDIFFPRAVKVHQLDGDNGTELTLKYELSTLAEEKFLYLSSTRDTDFNMLVQKKHLKELFVDNNKIDDLSFERMPYQVWAPDFSDKKEINLNFLKIPTFGNKDLSIILRLDSFSFKVLKASVPDNRSWILSISPIAPYKIQPITSHLVGGKKVYRSSFMSIMSHQTWPGISFNTYEQKLLRYALCQNIQDRHLVPECLKIKGFNPILKKEE